MNAKQAEFVEKIADAFMTLARKYDNLEWDLVNEENFNERMTLYFNVNRKEIHDALVEFGMDSIYEVFDTFEELGKAKED